MIREAVEEYIEPGDLADSEQFATMVEECQAIAEAVARIGRRYHTLKGKQSPREALADLLIRKKPPAPSVRRPVSAAERQEHRGKRAGMSLLHRPNGGVYKNMTTRPTLRPMREFDPSKSAVLHDTLNDRMIPWTGEDEAHYREHAIRNKDGTVGWDGLILDGWVEALGG
jgi:hypothetical protein